MTRLCTVLMLLPLAIAACGGRVTCAPGNVPNDVLQACVRPVPCDGGIVNERNECVLNQGIDTADAGMAGASGVQGGSTRTKRIEAGIAGAGGAGSNENGAGVGGVGAGGGGGAGPGVGGAGATGGFAASAARCGDGVTDPDEKCDGKCPSACPAQAGCTVFELQGSAARCTAQCVMTTITVTKAGDGCCPDGANASTDSDCSAKCGDGVLQAPEKCEMTSVDHPCPSARDCDDGDPCTDDFVDGSAAQCTAVCAHKPIMRAASSSCDDGNPCTDDTMIESKTACTYVCMHSTPRQPTGSCVDTDPCTDDTPVMSTTQCSVTCPHARQQPMMAATCDDGNPCTDDTSVMSRTQCAYDCSHSRMPTGMDCGNGRMCSNAGRCEAPPLSADGASCKQANECASGHCGNGICCSGNTCCSSVADCPAATGSCVDSSTCQGKKTRYECTRNACVQIQEDDDSDCAGRIVSCSAKKRKDIRCTEEKSQPDASKCACNSSDDCLGGTICIYDSNLVGVCGTP